MSAPCHLAFPVHDLAAARALYGDLLGCPEERSATELVDLDFFGHQIVGHLSPAEIGLVSANEVGGHGVPIRHFGIVLPMDLWNKTADTLSAAGMDFLIEPYARFKGKAGEQATMVFKGPSGNAIEKKAFADIGQLFAK